MNDFIEAIKLGQPGSEYMLGLTIFAVLYGTLRIFELSQQFIERRFPKKEPYDKYAFMKSFHIPESGTYEIWEILPDSYWSKKEQEQQDQLYANGHSHFPLNELQAYARQQRAQKRSRLDDRRYTHRTGLGSSRGV